MAKLNKLKNLKSRFGEILEPNAIPIKKGKNVSDYDNSSKLINKGKDPEEMLSIPEKKGKDISPFQNLGKLEKEGKNVSQFDNTNKLESQGKDVDVISPTPNKPVKEVNEFDNSLKLESQGKNVSQFDNTNKLENQGKNVSQFDNSLKLESHGKDVNTFDNTNKLESQGKDVDTFNNSLKLESQGKDVNTFDNTNKLENQGKDVDTFDNSAQHGEPLGEHIPENSLLDDFPSPPSSKWNDTFTSTDMYEDKINSTPFGRLVDRAPDFISDAPGMSNHKNVIGDPNEGAHPTQAVNSIGNGSSYFSKIPNEIPGFINVGDNISILKSTLLGFGFGESTSNSNLANILEPRLPFEDNYTDDGVNITTKSFDSRQSRQYPAGGSDEIFNVNSYGGSTFDNIYSAQLHNISGLDTSNLTAGFWNSNIPDLLQPQINDGLSDSGYDEYTYDPRSERIGVLPNITVGQPDVKFPNPKNPYPGSKFDDPLISGIEGGGLFNKSTDVYSNVFRNINKPSMKDIAESGNIKNPSDGYSETKTAMGYYENTGGIWTPDANEEISKYIDSTSNSEGNINLSNSSWFYGGNFVGPSTNTWLNASLSNGSSSSPTRTITIDGSTLSAQQLGYGDLTFDTIYDRNSGHPVGILDNRLDIMYGSGGVRGEEPYQLYNIPLESEGRTNSQLFNWNTSYNFMGYMGESNRKGGRFDDDKDRIESYLKSTKGQEFTSNLTRLFQMNARNGRNFNQEALTTFDFSKKTGHTLNMGGIGQLLLGSDVYAYPFTLYEKTLGMFLGVETLFNDNTWGKVATTALSVLNIAYGMNKSPIFLGGNAFQVKGFLNPEGYTDKSNVTPITPGDLIKDNIQNAILNLIPIIKDNTDAGGMNENANPRSLKFEQGATRGNSSGGGGAKLKKKFRSDTSHDASKGDKYLEKLKIPKYSEIEDNEFKDPNTGAHHSMNTRNGGFGDYMTMLPISTDKGEADQEKHGMPCYFKDMRNNKYIIFRGFINGLTENLSANWAETQYLGRPEPVYQYSNSSRDLSFQLKIASQTRNELDKIYTKLNALTSLCYPTFMEDTTNFQGIKVGGLTKARLKPPLVQFRLGDLYGKDGNLQLCVIESISYNYPDNSPWETENGARVPKNIDVSFTMKLINHNAPDSTTDFYGYVGK